MQKMKIIICLVLPFLALVCYASKCHLPPAHWCDNVEIASECKVLSQCDEFVWQRHTLGASENVSVTLYMESLCPDCKNFVQKQLTPTWKKVASIMNLELVPYGNAHEKQEGGKWVFECQHGLQECIGNQIETCAIHKYPRVFEHYPFIDCIEEAATTMNTNVTALAEKCAMQTGLDFKKIMKCSYSPWGNLLEHKMAEKTDALNPPHTGVPWVTINGVHTDAIQKAAETDLLKLVCDTYMGEKPKECTM